MENSMVEVAKINVLSCEPRMNRDRPNIQETDRDLNPLWSIDCLEKTYNEKHNRMMEGINKYKTLVELEPGEHIVKLKVSTIGEAKGSFTAVNKFYTVVSTIDKDTKIGGIFAPINVIPPSKRKVAEAKASSQVQ